MAKWKLSITTKSNLYAEGIVRRVDRSYAAQGDPTLSGGARGRFVTLRTERPDVIMVVTERLQRDMEFGAVTRIEIVKESD